MIDGSDKTDGSPHSTNSFFGHRRGGETSSQRVARLIAGCVGVGRLPLAPGTWGTLVGFVVALPAVFLPLTVRIGWLVCGLFVAYWSLRNLRDAEQQGDASWIVVDEVLGIWTVVLPLAGHLSVEGWVAAFVLFRLFDIAKPFPVSAVERSPTGARHGLPILLDDIVAAVWTTLVISIWSLQAHSWMPDVL